MMNRHRIVDTELSKAATDRDRWRLTGHLCSPLCRPLPRQKSLTGQCTNSWLLREAVFFLTVSFLTVSGYHQSGPPTGQDAWCRLAVARGAAREQCSVSERFIEA